MAMLLIIWLIAHVSHNRYFSFFTQRSESLTQSQVELASEHQSTQICDGSFALVQASFKLSLIYISLRADWAAYPQQFAFDEPSLLKSAIRRNLDASSLVAGVKRKDVIFDSLNKVFPVIIS